MFTTTTLLTFLVASVAIILAPGPAQALVLTRSLSEGKRAGLLTAVGLNIGTLVHAAAAGWGLSAILATSALAFALVKIVGAGYLIYLGWQALSTKGPVNDMVVPGRGTNSRQVFTKAVVTGILNPKVALFFLAFLPQFVDPARGPAYLQFLILGVVLALLDVAYEVLLVLIVAALGQRLAQNPRFQAWRQRLMGVVLIGLGVRLAFVQPE